MAQVFKDDLAYSKEGVKEVMVFLNRMDNVIGIKDVQDNERFQKDDIDLQVCMLRNIEVKVDRRHDTGNIFFEFISNIERGTVGWVEYCKADVLFYYFREIKVCYIFKWGKMKEWLDVNKGMYRVGTSTNEVGKGVFYHSKGYLVPIKEMYTIPDIDFKKQFIS